MPFIFAVASSVFYAVKYRWDNELELERGDHRSSRQACEQDMKRRIRDNY